MLCLWVDPQSKVAFQGQSELDGFGLGFFDRLILILRDILNPGH